ncbi:hypothetical protein Hokovirus_1_159 [Hokovirus HKV1]|uniref:Uncharacterized protein n=1 Tax=Hokovirus HKV1 TaxID=1977638 RepID=A0A1V0SEY2_9VIRU|nr:hypothetical protein Hokovirus_1_159 [Hokovirus HKV1]
MPSIFFFLIFLLLFFYYTLRYRLFYKIHKSILVTIIFIKKIDFIYHNLLIINYKYINNDNMDI